MFDRLKEDIQSVKDRDPAATSTIQILLLYPGLKAIRMHKKSLLVLEPQYEISRQIYFSASRQKDRNRD